MKYLLVGLAVLILLLVIALKWLDKQIDEVNKELEKFDNEMDSSSNAVKRDAEKELK